MGSEKRLAADLAAFGGKKLFSEVRSTSNLVKPNETGFFSYLKKSYRPGLAPDNAVLIDEFEQRLAKLHGTEHCVAFCSGLWALVLAMKCLAVEGKTEIVMPSLTYRRLADIAAWLKLTPHFCDVSLESKGITAEAAEACINENTALILGVQPIVNLCDIDGLVDLANHRQLPLLFDSVEAAYGTHNGQKIGSFGDAECFSMHASKFLNGFEAGYVTTSNAQLASRLRHLRNSENIDLGPGLNANLSELHAAMGLASLDDLEAQVDRNKKRYEAYRIALAKTPGLDLWEYSSREQRTYKNIVVTLNDRWPFTLDQTLTLMHAENMLVRPYYTPALHAKKTHYRTLKGNLENTEILANKNLLLPCGEMVSVKDIEETCAFLVFLQGQNDEIFARPSQMREL